jgi:uncharacterized membrane protein
VQGVRWREMNNQINSEPLSRTGKILVALTILGLVAIWIFAIYAYLTLPKEVPVHFGFKGEPTRYGSKSAFLIVPVAFSIAPVIFLLLTKFRFTLINRYPYLINLPAFFTNISKIPEKKRGFWVNKYFEAVLCLGAVLTFSLFIMELGIYLGKISSKLPVWFFPFSLSMPLWLIFPFLFYLGKLSKEMNGVRNER